MVAAGQRCSALQVARNRNVAGVDPHLVDQIEHAAAHTAAVSSVHDIRVRWEGHRLRADLAGSVDPSLNVAEAHRLAHAVEHELVQTVPHLDAAVIHVEPNGPNETPLTN